MASNKELFIVRHAKSSWDIDDISDIDRPLKLRGIRDAYEMARRLKIERRLPQSFISSPANRALHTAVIFLAVLEVSFRKLSIDAQLYGHGMDDIFRLIASQPEEVSKLMIFGHNPDFTELARHFARKSIFEIPTCGIAVFQFKSTKWSGLINEPAISEYFDFPKKAQ